MSRGGAQDAIYASELCAAQGNPFTIRTWCEVSPAAALLAEKFVRLRFESAPVRPLVAPSSDIATSLLPTQKRERPLHPTLHFFICAGRQKSECKLICGILDFG